MKNMLVLGANSDIAKEIMKQFRFDNFHFILAGRQVEQLEALSSDLEREHISSSVVPFDALNMTHIPVFFTQLLSEYEEVEGVLLAYGYLGDQKEGQENTNEARKVIDTNFTSAVLMLELFARYFEERKRGFIYGISSVAGDRGRKSNYLYGSSKAGLTAYLSGLRNRLYESGIHVLTIKPGFVATKMTEGKLNESPLVASPEEVAKDVYRAAKRKKDVVYTPRFWVLILFALRCIPEWLFKRLNT